MGINMNAGFSLILKDKRGYMDFKGMNILMLGKQDVGFSREDLAEMLDRLNFTYCRDTMAECADTAIDSYDLFKILGFSDVHALDISNYEGADIIFDLASKELPEELCGRFDYIYNGGTLEHVFDFPTAINNVSKMIKQGGTVIHDVPCNNFVEHGFYSFSPTAFIDYYNVNCFLINHVFLMSYSTGAKVNAISPDCRYNDMKTWLDQYAEKQPVLCVISVTKSKGSTNDRYPRMQYHYEMLEKYGVIQRKELLKKKIIKSNMRNIALYGSGATAKLVLEDEEIRRHVVGIYDINLNNGQCVEIRGGQHKCSGY